MNTTVTCLSLIIAPFLIFLILFLMANREYNREVKKILSRRAGDIEKAKLDSIHSIHSIQSNQSNQRKEK